MKKELGDKDIQQVIGELLRYGVMTACIVAIIGGAIYLYKHSSETIPNYTSFHGETASFTSVSGIIKGMFTGNATEIIQFGVVILLATPILRVILSLFSFALEKDKMYIIITLIVLCVLMFSMFSGLKI